MAVGTPRNCGDDTIATARGNRSRVLSLMSALRVNFGSGGLQTAPDHHLFQGKPELFCPIGQLKSTGQFPLQSRETSFRTAPEIAAVGHLLQSMSGCRRGRALDRS